MINFKRYKCYYDYEHCLEDISRNFCINIHQMEFHSVFSRPLVLFRLPLLLLKSHHLSTFFAISRQIRVHTTCDQKVLESFTANKPTVLPIHCNEKQNGKCTKCELSPCQQKHGILEVPEETDNSGITSVLESFTSHKRVRVE
ncbi:hypothetical protein T05_15724 [Trichinella murrelli]|uniref:Uncharacterized protein n=1 Tax=Trichinella murrelli TaxID=144512 RepID=A0A0V0TPG0_9BILA|nr:hypothetical protein T05_15724 [Trichinella murrelli]